VNFWIFAEFFQVVGAEGRENRGSVWSRNSDGAGQLPVTWFDAFSDDFAPVAVGVLIARFIVFFWKLKDAVNIASEVRR